MRKILFLSLFLAVLGLISSGSLTNLILAGLKAKLSSHGILTNELNIEAPFSLSAKEVVLSDGTKLSNIKASPSLSGYLNIIGEVFGGSFDGALSTKTKKATFLNLDASKLPKVGKYVEGSVSGFFEEATKLDLKLSDGAVFYEKIVPKIEINTLEIKGDLKQGTFNLSLNSKAGELNGQVRLTGFKLEGQGSGKLTEVGTKDVGPWLGLLGAPDLRANQEFSISVLGSIANPVVKVFKK